MSQLHWDALAPGVREAYDQISRALPDGDFYLAGGTALALLEGHRISVDLDVFSSSMPDLEQLVAQLEATLREVEIRSISEKTLYLLLAGTQISIIEYGYPMLHPASAAGTSGLALANHDDLAAMKLSAIANRGSRKDFFDLWVLLRRHRSLSEYLDLYRRKFAQRDIGHVIRSLVYFDEADREPPLRLLIEADWGEVKADLRQRVAGVLA